MSGKDSTSSEIDPYVGKLNTRPCNLHKWREDYLIHAKEKYGDFSLALSEGKDPIFDLAKEFGITAGHALHGEYEKKSLELNLEFRKAKPKMFGDIMKHLSPDSTIRVRGHMNYSRANANNNIAELWKIVISTHLSNPSSKATQIAAEQNVLRNMKQGTMGIEKYNEQFKFQVEKLTELGKKPDEDDIVSVYLYSLAPVFVDTAKKMLKNSTDFPLPATLSDATFQIEEWYNTELAVNKMFGVKTTAAAPTVETALVATTTDTPATGKPAKGDPKGRKDRNSRHRDKRQNKAAAEDKKDNSGSKSEFKGKPCELCKRGGFAANHLFKDCRHMKRFVKEGESTKGEGKPEVKSNLAQESPAAADAKDMEETFSWPSEVTVTSWMATSEPPASNPAGAFTLVMDTGTTSILVRDRILLSNIKKLTVPVRINGVGGEKYAYEMGILGPFGAALYLPQGPANLVPWADLKAKKFKRAFNDDRESFILTRGKERYEFQLCTDKAHPNCGLYIRTVNVPAQVTAAAAQVVNNQIFTTREIERAHEARRLHKHLDHISDHNLCGLLNNGGILNCPTTAHDVRNAAKILGPCPDCLQGKMTEPSGKTSERPTCENIAEILFMDLFFVHDGTSTKKAPHLLSVDGRYGHMIVTKLASKNTAALTVAIQATVNIYRSMGHVVKEIRVDHEKNFLACKSVVNGMGVQLSATVPGQHNTRAERPIRTIRTRFRAVLTSLGFNLPRILYPILVMNVVSALNMTPNVHTFPLTPNELVTGKKIDAGTVLRAKFGDFVVAKTPNMGKDQDHLPTGELGIVVGRDSSGKGNVKIYKLDTNTVVVRGKCEVITPSPENIKKINEIAGKDTPVDNIDIEDDYADTPVPSVRDLLEGSPDSTGVPPPIREDLKTPVLSAPLPPLAPVAQPPPMPEQLPADAAPGVGALPHAASGVATPPRAAQKALAPPIAVELASARPTVVSPPAPAIPAEPPPRFVHTLSPERRTSRSTRTTWKEAGEKKENFGLHVSVSRALQQYPGAAVQALGKEALQLIDMQAIFPVHKQDLKPNPERSIIPSIMFLKEKFKPDGEFDKLKARMAGGGHVMNPVTMELTAVSSPTVDPTSVFTLAAIAAHQGLGASVTDIKGAYLNADLPDSVDVIMIVDAITTAVLVELRPEFAKYVRPNGTMLTRVKKALYGLPQAGLLWYKHLRKTLESIGYKATTADTCVFTKNNAHGKSIIAVHVDDLFHVFTDSKSDDVLQSALKKVYKETNHVRGDRLDYLGMVLKFDRKAKSVSLSNPGYISDLLKSYNINGIATTPATTNLLNNDDSAERVDQKEYASMVMKVMYLAKKTRPDIIQAVTYLATRITHCNRVDRDKLIRVYKYLNNTRDYELVLSPDDLHLRCYADASYATHADAKSHSGAVLVLGTNRTATLYVRSAKQKLVSRSSTEAELIALHDVVPQVLWMRQLLGDLGFPCAGPTTIFQDNKSTIIIGNKGNANKGKSKHIDVRYFSIKEKIDELIVKLEYLSTDRMLADFCTKPLSGASFSKLCSAILGRK